MKHRIAAALLSFSLVLGIAAMTGNPVMAQQAMATAQAGGKASDTQAASPDMQDKAASESNKQQEEAAQKPNAADAAVKRGAQPTNREAAVKTAPQPTVQNDGTAKNAPQPEAEKQYPVTAAVEDRTDVLEFADDKDGFRILIPSELTVYPLGVNPVAVLRGENTETGLRLAIDASAIDNRGPLMPFQVEAFRSDFIRMVKSSVKDSANDKKISLLKEEEINGQKAVHVVSSTLTTDGKRRLLRDEYVFVTQNRMFVVMYMMDEKLYPQYNAKIPEWMQSVQISQVWKKITVKGTNFTTEVPASCIDLKDPTELEKTMEIYGNESIMIGLVSSPRETFGFMPESLAGLSAQDQAKVLEGLQAKLMADTKNAATGYRGEFLSVNGETCVKATYEVNGSKNESYTFVKDGKVLELGFVFKGENETAIRPVIAHATETLQM